MAGLFSTCTLDEISPRCPSHVHCFGFHISLLAIPAFLIGGVAKSAGKCSCLVRLFVCSTEKRKDHNECFLLPDWTNGTDYGLDITSHAKDVLPLT